MTNENIAEAKFLIYTILAIILLISLHMFQPQLHSIYNPVNYVSIHTILELFSISISAAIFFYGIKAYGVHPSSKMLLLAFTFLTVGFIDLLHTISFKGMPFFLTESSVAKATWFWVIGRIINAVLILAILLKPDHKLTKDYRPLAFLGGATLTALIGFIVFYYEKTLPPLMIEGQGTTLLKNVIEYAVCFLLFIGLLTTLYKYHLEKNPGKLDIALGLVFMLLMELIFTVYQNIYDLDNFIGHVFKVFGFYFIFKGFYFSKSDDKKHESKPQEPFHELPGFIFKAEKTGEDFICVFCEGMLLDEIGLTREELIGKSIAKVLTTNKVPFNEYCRLSSKLKENIAFEMNYMGRVMIVSLRSYSETDEHEILLGSVIDVTGIQYEAQFSRKAKKEFQAVM